MKPGATGSGWGADLTRLVLIGHSYGGYVAACAEARNPDIKGAALIAPWDISMTGRDWHGLAPDKLEAMAKKDFDDVDGRLTGADAVELAHTIVETGASMDLARLAPALATRPLLVVTASDDTADDQAEPFLAASGKHAGLEAVSLETDHGFNDHRIALETIVLDWLGRLSVAPR